MDFGREVVGKEESLLSDLVSFFDLGAKGGPVQSETLKGVGALETLAEVTELADFPGVDGTLGAFEKTEAVEEKKEGESFILGKRTTTANLRVGTGCGEEIVE